MADMSASRRKDIVLDEYLVLASQSGDGRAFDALVRRWHRKLVAHAWRLTGSKDAAADTVQSAWVEILRALPGLRDETAFPAWAYRIVTRRAARHIAGKIADRKIATALAEDPAAEAPGPSPALGLQGALAKLSPPHRAAVALHYFEGLSVAEIAVALEVPAGTIKTRLMHARKLLRTQLKETGNAPS